MITLFQLSMSYGPKVLFKNVTLQFNPGNHYGLVGANGCGKSTLIKILTGEISSESGSFTMPQQVNVGSLCQDHYLHENSLVMDVVLQGNRLLWEALEKKRVLLEKENFTAENGEALARFDKLIEEQEGYSAEAKAAKLLEGLGIREDSHGKPLSFLSGGYKLRALLAQVLFGNPDILILDEPTNHLDLYSIKWLEDYLRNFSGTLLVTSHDRGFLNQICTHIADVDYGTIKIYKGDYEAFLGQKSVDRELKEHLLQKHDKRRTELQGFIDRFGAKSTKARQAQSKARLVEQIEEEMEHLDLLPSSRIYPNIQFDPLRASGITALTIKNLCKSFASKNVLVNVSCEVERGERLAIIGPNGIGKSTILEIITGHQNADSGTFAWGFAARWAYFPQDHTREFKGDLSLLDWLGQFDRDIPGEQLRNILGRVLFSGDVANQSIHTLSGGEKARLVLAKLMMQKPNVLIFDEPTNHLDMEAIEELIKALKLFEGTLILVSHNRYFVSCLANRILEISHQGVKDHKGSYEDYLEKQSLDYLNARPMIGQRYELKDPSSKSISSANYDDYKKLKSQKAQLKKKVAQTEEDCHQLERKIHVIEQTMASEGYYQIAPREEQQQLSQQKRQLESNLIKTMEQWEDLSLELQKFEEDK